jgi:hypothetical protein
MSRIYTLRRQASTDGIYTSKSKLIKGTSGSKVSDIGRFKLASVLSSSLLEAKPLPNKTIKSSLQFESSSDSDST